MSASRRCLSAGHSVEPVTCSDGFLNFSHVAHFGLNPSDDILSQSRHNRAIAYGYTN